MPINNILHTAEAGAEHILVNIIYNDYSIKQKEAKPP